MLDGQEGGQMNEEYGYRSAHETKNETIWSWIFAGVFTALPLLAVYFFPIEFNFDVNSPDFNPLCIIPASLGAYALVTIVKAIRVTVHHRKFGDSTLVIPDYVGVFDEPMTGFLKTSGVIRPESDWSFDLQCIETRVSRISGRNHSEEILLWHATDTVSAATHQSTNGIPFSFFIPKNCLKKKKNGVVSWKITVKARLPGADFIVDFPVRVVEKAPPGYRAEDDD